MRNPSKALGRRASAMRGRGAPRLPGDESFPKVDDARNPEKLAGNQRHEEGGEEQEIEGPLAPIGNENEGAKSNPRESDHAHALVSSEETDHRRGRLRKVNAIIDLEPAETCMNLLTQFPNKSRSLRRFFVVEGFC